jgi:UDP-4-amino-4,6-dideoxy-N-acetyl-beta-L-altrosamine transaminase
MIPYGRQDISQGDIDAVVDVLRSDFLTQGPAVPRFERAVASRVGATHALAMSSATAALHVACLALDLGKDDLLWTVPNTFVASANCARYCGAGVDFVDIDPVSWNMSVPLLEAKLQKARRTGRLPKVVVPVHFSGQAPDQQAIHALSKAYGFRVIEDASHAIGASRDGEPVGSCRWSDITVFSFHPVKIITTGEGGMALTNAVELAERMAKLRTHGITRDPNQFVGEAGGAWYYEQQLLGFNYRMTEMQAALGTSQLTRLDAFVERRNAIARRYDSLLQGMPLRLPVTDPRNVSAWHLYVVRLQREKTSLTHRHLFDLLRDRGIGVNLHYMPVHLQPYYRALGFAPAQFAEAEAHGAEAITLPLYPALSEAEQDMIVGTLGELLGHD